MSYDTFLHIKNKKGQYVIQDNYYNYYDGHNITKATNNFFKAINSTLEWSEDIWKDTPPKPEYAHYWTKIDNGSIPIWTEPGPHWAGELELTTPEGIKAFLESNGYADIVPDDIEYICIGWNT